MNLQLALERVNNVLSKTADSSAATAQTTADSIEAIKTELMNPDGTGLSEDITTDLDNIWNRINDDIKLVLEARVTTLTNAFNEL